MPNAYGDLTTLKSPAFLNTPDDGHDERLLEMLETASRWIDGYCDRHFFTTQGERRFDGTGRVTLAVNDLVSANEVRVRQGSTGRWVGWNSGDWLAYPLNAAPTEPDGRPYTRLVATAGGRRFPLSRGGVIITGAWGYGDVREDTGLQVSAPASQRRTRRSPWPQPAAGRPRRCRPATRSGSATSRCTW